MSSSGNQFDVNSAILNALAGLEVTLDVRSTVKLDAYQTGLAFKQFNVPAITDRTALFLIGVVAPPVVQMLVNSAVLSFEMANITYEFTFFCFTWCSENSFIEQKYFR